mmetsp:Transcript_24720/g.67395  ORF Transcript_24720/g.67395 Transcript_24720/m.67395 type:complete len:125 (+) Transcript_24720:5738-6112(+)
MPRTVIPNGVPIQQQLFQSGVGFDALTAPSFSSPFQARLKLFKLRLPSKPARKPFTPSAFIWFQLKSRCVNVVFSFSRSPNAAAVLFPSELLERLRTFRVRLKFCRALVIASPEASAIPHCMCS